MATPTIDINAIVAALQPAILQAVQQAVANAMPAPPPVIVAPPIAVPTAPIQITMGSTIAHIQPLADLFNNALAGLLPPPYNLIPKALSGVGHLIAASSGQVAATPDSVGQAINDITTAGLGGLQAGGIHLPPWLQNIIGALHPPEATK